MMGNVHRVMRQKTRELRPRRKKTKVFGTGTVGVNKNAVSPYEY